MRSSLGFVWQRIVWYALVFAMPLFVVAFFGVLLAIGGAVFFNVPVLDVIGAVLFVIALGIGFALSLILIVEGFSWPLFQPALSVEGTDAFDAVARAFNYVMGRPLRYMFYMFVSLVSGLVSTLFVALVVYVVLRATRGFVGSGVFVEGRIDAIMPPVDWRDMTYAPNDSQTIAGLIVMIWVNLLVAVIAAYMVSYFYTATTWVYLLLRRSSDGTEFDEIFIDVDSQTTVADAPAEPTAVADAAKAAEEGDSASQNSIN
jgi:hypothetical protein